MGSAGFEPAANGCLPPSVSSVFTKTDNNRTVLAFLRHIRHFRSESALFRKTLKVRCSDHAELRTRYLRSFSFLNRPFSSLLLFSFALEVSRKPLVLSYLLRLAETAGCAYAFLYVKSHTSASTTAYVLHSDFLSERRCSFCHFLANSLFNLCASLILFLLSYLTFFGLYNVGFYMDCSAPRLSLVSSRASMFSKSP